jgi:hypothetical protein
MAFATPEDSFHPHVFWRSPFNISRHQMCILGASNGERRLLLSRPPVPLHDGINITEPRTPDNQESTATHPTIDFLTKLTTIGIGRRFQHRDILNSTHESQCPNVRTFRDLRHHAIGIRLHYDINTLLDPTNGLNGFASTLSSRRHALVDLPSTVVKRSRMCLQTVNVRRGLDRDQRTVHKLTTIGVGQKRNQLHISQDDASLAFQMFQSLALPSMSMDHPPTLNSSLRFLDLRQYHFSTSARGFQSSETFTMSRPCSQCSVVGCRLLSQRRLTFRSSLLPLVSLAAKTKLSLSLLLRSSLHIFLDTANTVLSSTTLLTTRRNQTGLPSLPRLVSPLLLLV